MGIIGNFLTFMEDKRSLPLAILFVLSPAILTAVLNFLIGIPINIFPLVISAANAVLQWFLLSLVLIALLHLFKEKAGMNFTEVLNSASIVFFLISGLIISFVAGIVVVMPDLFYAMNSAAATDSYFERLAILGSVHMPSDFALLAFGIFMLIVVLAGAILSIYVFYRIIADYSKATLTRNLAILVAFLVLGIAVVAAESILSEAVLQFFVR